MFKITFSPEAKKDIKGILEYSLETFGEPQTDNYKDEMNNAFISIQKMPTIGHVRKDTPLNYLSLVSGQHSIVYRIDKKINKVLVIRILHSRMDFTQKF